MNKQDFMTEYIMKRLESVTRDEVIKYRIGCKLADEAKEAWNIITDKKD